MSYGPTGPDPAAPVEVPFAGLRRNARALVGGLLLVLVIAFLIPDLGPPPSGPPPAELQRGKIVSFLPQGTDATAPDVRIEVLSGPTSGQIVDGRLASPSGSTAPRSYVVGDEVVVIAPREPSATVSVGALYRAPALGLLLATFAFAVIAVGGWRGLRSLIALVLAVVVVVRIVVPLILAGHNPAWVAILAATGVAVATLLLTDGARTHTIAAALGTFVALALTAVLAVVFDDLARLTSLRAAEDTRALQAIGLGDIDLGGLILAAIIFGALGILGDVTVTQAATVSEVRVAEPRLSRLALAARSMRVGRSHMVATVSSLTLAYVGASLALIVLFSVGRQDPLLVASTDAVAVEVVRAMVGSIGIVAAVPLTTLFAVALADRALPFIRDAEPIHRAPGWD